MVTVTTCIEYYNEGATENNEARKCSKIHIKNRKETNCH